MRLWAWSSTTKSDKCVSERVEQVIGFSIILSYNSARHRYTLFLVYPNSAHSRLIDDNNNTRTISNNNNNRDRQRELHQANLDPLIGKQFVSQSSYNKIPSRRRNSEKLERARNNNATRSLLGIVILEKRSGRMRCATHIYRERVTIERGEMTIRDDQPSLSRRETLSHLRYINICYGFIMLKGIYGARKTDVFARRKMRTLVTTSPSRVEGVFSRNRPSDWN